MLGVLWLVATCTISVRSKLSIGHIPVCVGEWVCPIVPKLHNYIRYVLLK